MHTVEQNAIWANDAAAFVRNQIANRNIALKLRTRVEEWILLPYFAMTQNYSAIRDFVYFVPDARVEKTLSRDEMDKYTQFRESITPDEIKLRMQKRQGNTATVAPAND